MGVISTTKIVCGLETKQSHAKALQPENREWVTAIIAINAIGWSLPLLQPSSPHDLFSF